MKPHLPVRLFRAVALVLAAAPAALYADYTAPTEIVVPDSYTNSVKLNGAVDFATQTENTAYRLTGDVTMSLSGSFSQASYLYTSDSADNLASISFTKPSGSTSVSTQVSFDSLKDVSFSSFSSPWSHGGAVYMSSGSFNFSNNEGINFSNNVVVNSDNMGNGAGICIEGSGSTSFLNNGVIVFELNNAGNIGGAIAQSGSNTNILFEGNNRITFSSNTTYGRKGGGQGGALANEEGNVKLNHNGVVTFSENVANGKTHGQGGAIYTSTRGSGNVVELCYNNSVTFENNVAQCNTADDRDGNGVGAAILASGTDVLLNGNGTLKFSGNKALAQSGLVAEGGAIRVGYGSDLSIQNNGTVIFEDNMIQVGSTVKYNSIYADDSVVVYNPNNPSQYRIYTYELDVEISAPEEGSVEFRDCAFIDVSQDANSSFLLNSTYTDENGNSIAQTGDIIFTGYYMDSGDKTSEFKGTASLHDGRLIVRDGAVLNAENLVIAESASGESTPTLVVDNATIGGSITVNGGTVMGSGTLGALTMNGGELVVGNSPGVQTYTDDVELTKGMVTFSLADFDAAATAETQGWDSSAYSFVDMQGHDLTIGEDVTFTFEIGGEALAQLLSSSGESLSFSLELFRNIGTLTLDGKTIEDLIAASEFIITSDEEGLMDGLYAEYAGQNVTEQVTSAFYTTEDGKVVLTVTMASVPEPTTATLSLLALAALAARRRRR